MLCSLRNAIKEFRIVKLIFCLVVMLSLTGCWDKKEFNQMAVVQTMAVDKQGEEYKVTLQLITPKAGAKGITADDLWIISGQGDSVSAALAQADLSTPRRIYLEQMNLILLGEGVLSDDLVGGYRYLTHSHYLRRNNYVLAIKGEAGKILEAKPTLGKIDIFYLTNLIKDQERKVKNSVTLINDCLLANHSVSSALFIPAVILEKEEKITFNGGALLKNNQLVEWVEQSWVDGYYWICGQIKQAPLTLKNVWEQGDMLVLETERSSCRLSLKNEEPLTLKLEIEAKMDMVDNRGIHNVADEKSLVQSLNEAELKAEEKIVEIVTKSLREAQSLNCDVFNIGQWLYAFYPQITATRDWQNNFTDVEFDIEAEVTIRSLLINQK